MDDRERHPVIIVLRLMSLMEAEEQVVNDGACDRHRDANVRRASRAKKARERCTLDVFHHEKKVSVVSDDIERWDDVRMTEARSEPRFIHEHRHEGWILRELWVHAL